jgi:gliding motility-associated lipoprotein GldK
VYTYHPFDGTKMLDASQMNYRYETFDYALAAQRKYRLNPSERNLNTDIVVDPNEEVMISKDTAYIDDEGRIVRQTLTRPLSSMWDFVNTYIINIYPDTTCWVNDFQNAENEIYMRLYFSHPNYNEYPVVGVNWEQANAFCNWRTDFLMKGLGGNAKFIQRYRLPTEAEWEFAARGKEGNELPWENEDVKSDKGCYYANFKPDRGNYTMDGNIITSKVGIYSANSNGLYDMAGNVAEWTSTVYTEAGVLSMSDLNPTLKYNAAIEDPYALKKKSVRGGSWKDPESFIKSAWRTSEFQNVGRSFVGFRCVRTQVGTATKQKK